MIVLAIARTSLTRLMRDRRALFMLLVLPILVIVIIGATVRGFNTEKVGVLDEGAGPAGRHLVAALERAPGIVVTTYSSLTAIEQAVARSEVEAGVVLPAGMTAMEGGRRVVRVGVIAEQANSTQQAAATAVAAVVAADGSEVQAARFTATHGLASFTRGLSLARSVGGRLAGVRLRTIEADTTASMLPGGFSYSAPTELVLFVFLSALAAAAALIDTRRLGVFERMSAAPVRASFIIAGESVTYIATALVQSIAIVVIGTVGFGVSWGDPVAAVLLVLLWCLVGAGAGMLAGTMFRTPEQASAMGPILGIVFAMLGGCMWPLSIVSSTMREVGHVTPQAWAVDAWTSIVARGAGLGGIAGDLGVLALFAAGFFALATARFRRHFLATS